MSKGFLYVEANLIYQLFVYKVFLKRIHLLGQNRLQSLLTLNKWTFECLLKSGDFEGDFSLINKCFFKNLKLRKVVKSS